MMMMIIKIYIYNYVFHAIIHTVVFDNAEGIVIKSSYTYCQKTTIISCFKIVNYTGQGSRSGTHQNPVNLQTAKEKDI